MCHLFMMPLTFHHAPYSGLDNLDAALCMPHLFEVVIETFSAERSSDGSLELSNTRFFTSHAQLEPLRSFS